MANEAALKFLDEKITALQMINQELTNIFMSTGDLDLADSIRADITSQNQVLFALRSARNSLAATANEVPPPSEARVEALTAALRRLDGFVRSDQNIQSALDFLNGVANLISKA
jgi:hypothetical protein